MSRVQQQTVQRPGPRLHRLPRRLDYMLIPAPLDLSLSTMTEKSPLPAIIVTPSSPTHSKDFAIAFLAPPKSPSMAQRASKYLSGVSESLFGSIGRVWGKAESPIALPLSAPATTTEFKFGSYTNAKRNSRILMVVLTVFFLVFCHMLAHFFAYAAPMPMTQDTLSMGVDVQGGMSGGEGKDVVKAYFGKLDIQKWLGWMAGGSSGSGSGGVHSTP